MNVISQDAFAKIAVNKSLLKEYSSSKYQRVVYLNDGDEFQIQLFNPEQHPIAAKITIIIRYCAMHIKKSTITIPPVNKSISFNYIPYFFLIQ